MAKQEPINLLQFQKKFNSEEACHQHLFKMKWPNGFLCPECSNSQAYEIQTRTLPLYECTECRHQTTVKVGTILEKSRIDLVKWCWAIFLVAHDKRGVSATYLKEELELSYQTAWTIHHKICKAMGDRDASYTLSGLVELDDAFFGAPTEGGKRGRGTDQTKVLVGLSLNKQGAPQYLKMKVIPDVKGITLMEFAEKNIVPGSTINSDAYSSYFALAKSYDHQPLKFNVVENPDHLKWIHTIISNAKAFIGGTYTGWMLNICNRISMNSVTDLIVEPSRVNYLIG